MKRRNFLRAAIGVSALSGVESISAKGSSPVGPVVLTISGQVSHPNRGQTDEALDQLMHKHGVVFRQARTFSYGELDELPSLEIRTTLEYDAKAHSLSGPTLLQLFEIAGAPGRGTTLVTLRAFDGYTVESSLADVRKFQYLVATRIDGHPMPLGGLGPLWAVYDADHIPELAAKPLAARFAQCPWGLYSVHVREPGSKQ